MKCLCGGAMVYVGTDQDNNKIYECEYCNNLVLRRGKGFGYWEFGKGHVPNTEYTDF